MSEEKLVKRVAFYAGRRITVKDKLAHFWKFKDEEDLLGYSKNPAPAMVGEEWEFTCTADGKYYTRGVNAPKRTGNRMPHNETWVAEDAAAVYMDSERRAKNRLAERRTDFDKALEPLKNLVNSTRSEMDRAALIHRITAELWRGR